jgi:hypothetical protein
MVKYITYQVNEKNLAADNKILEGFDSSEIIKILLSDEPGPPDSVNISEILFSIDNTFLKYESRDKFGDTIHMEIIPIKYVIAIGVWRKKFEFPHMNELSKQTRHSSK